MTECEEVAETMLDGYREWLVLHEKNSHPTWAYMYVCSRMIDTYQIRSNIADALHRRTA